MPDYSKGKIYQIISPNYPLPYIGSTTVALCKRMVDHRANRKTSSHMVIDAGDAYIELIEEFPCENKEQLNKREGEIIRERECVNRRIEGRTYKEYYTDNREAISAKHKAYYEANRDVLNTKNKAYYKANHDAIKAERIANSDAINAKRRAKRAANREVYNAQQRAYYQAKKNEAKSITE